MPTFVANLDICGDMSLALMTHLLIVPVRRFVLHNRTDSKIQPATQLKSSRRCVDSTRLNTSTSIIMCWVVYYLYLPTTTTTTTTTTIIIIYFYFGNNKINPRLLASSSMHFLVL
jgi:hypothetical protein